MKIVIFGSSHEMMEVSKSYFSTKSFKENVMIPFKIQSFHSYLHCITDIISLLFRYTPTVSALLLAFNINKTSNEHIIKSL